MKLRRLIPLLLLTLLAGCQGNPVGRICFIGVDAGTSVESIVASPALECQSRICLHTASQQSGDSDMCTAECSSDDDCDKQKESPCAAGFTCMVPVTIGPFCCRKLCVCRDYLEDLPDGGTVPFPGACDPSQEINRQNCSNL